MHRILVIGGGGQLARAIEWVARGYDVEVYAPTHADCDIADVSSIDRVLQGVDVVINTAAYTNVDSAEEECCVARMTNVIGARNVARMASERGITMIHISTDYVFGGDDTRHKPYSEGDATSPINVYGHTKAEGEVEVLRYGGIIIRTSWLYSPWGRNFCRTILRNAKGGHSLRVVDDQRGRPTSALSLARALMTLITSGEYRNMEGIYHYCNGGDATWYDFAREIVVLADINGCVIEPCSSDAWPTKAQRPRYSCLDMGRITAIRGISIVEWRDALDEVITIIRQSDEI